MSLFPSPISGESISGLYIRYLTLNGYLKNSWGDVFTRLAPCTLMVLPGLSMPKYENEGVLLTKPGLEFNDYLSTIFTDEDLYGRSQMGFYGTRNNMKSIISANGGIGFVYPYRQGEVVSHPILYCPKCHAEQLEEYGHLVLLTKWQNPLSPYCFKHDIHLQYAEHLLYPQNFIEQYSDFKPNKELISFYKWFDDLSSKKISYIPDGLVVHIIIMCHIRISGGDLSIFHAKIEEIVDAIFLVVPDSNPAFSALKFNCLTKYKQKNLEYENLNYSASQLWIICYLAFREFEVFWSEFGDQLI